MCHLKFHKAKGKDLTLKAKAKTKCVLKDPRGQGHVLEDSITGSVVPDSTIQSQNIVARIFDQNDCYFFGISSMSCMSMPNLSDYDSNFILV